MFNPLKACQKHKIKEKFGDILEEILESPNTESFPVVSMRGIKGRGYYTDKYGEKKGFFIGGYTEGEFTGQIKKERSLRKEDPEVFDVFLDFLVRIERNLHYLEKQEYSNLAKDFLDDQVTADDFSYSFMAIYGGIGQKLGQMERAGSVELANFLEPRRPELGELLARIYGSCDSSSPDPDITMADEQELKDCSQILLVELQKE